MEKPAAPCTFLHMQPLEMSSAKRRIHRKGSKHRFVTEIYSKKKKISIKAECVVKSAGIGYHFNFC